MAKYPGVSLSVTRRMPRYYRFLEDLMANGVERISSREFAELTGLTASQIRQDLNCFGGFGQQGYGYNVAALRTEIERILGLNEQIPVILLGAGNLGLAVGKHMKFEKQGFRLIGVFDSNPRLVGQKIRDLEVRSTGQLEAFCKKERPLAAILCIPRPAAVELAGSLVSWGVKGFWNFSHYDLSVAYGDGIVVENVHLGDSLMTLSFRVNELLDQS